MAGRITNFFRELTFPFSIISIILGLIILIVGSTGIWFSDIPEETLNLTEEILEWSPYFLIIGFIIFLTGIWYLYSYLKNRKFILDELETNKRSELLKKHAELKNTVKHMPSKYQRMLKAKEEELKIR